MKARPKSLQKNLHNAESSFSQVIFRTVQFNFSRFLMALTSSSYSKTKLHILRFTDLRIEYEGGGIQVKNQDCLSDREYRKAGPSHF